MVINMKNTSKKYLIFVTIGIVFIIISIPTIYKIIKNYNNKSYLVVEKRIKEAAKRCYNEKKCKGDSVTLKNLYKKKYLDIQVNPVTKKKYDEDLIIKKSKDGFIVNVR